MKLKSNLTPTYLAIRLSHFFTEDFDTGIWKSGRFFDTKMNFVLVGLMLFFYFLDLCMKVNNAASYVHLQSIIVQISQIIPKLPYEQNKFRTRLDLRSCGNSLILSGCGKCSSAQYYLSYMVKE